MSIDLSPWRAPAELIDAIWEIRRSGLRDRRDEIVRLLDHDDPTVREEVVSLLFVKWADGTLRDRLVDLVRSDPDPGVRARAAGALPAVSAQGIRQTERELLRGIVLDVREDDTVRRASYEALCRIVHGESTILDDATDLDEDVDLDWVRSL